MQKSAHLESLLDWLYSRVNYERQSKPTPDSFRLHTMRCLAQRLGNPQRNYPVIHVAGTKGKGSVTSMIGQILSVSGRKTGVYVSPHLESINQRILLNNLPIPDEDLEQVLRQLQPVVHQIDEEAPQDDLLRAPTFFDIITAAALYYFSQQRVDAAVLEVGLGGRLDSTNICQPQVSVITSISFDHMQQLGDTLGKIAYEKAGIVKSGVSVISGVPPILTEPSEVIESVARDRNSKLIQLNRDFSVEDPDRDDGFTFELRDEAGQVRMKDIRLSLFGTHQRTNAALAIATCLELNRQGWNLSEPQIREGLRQAWLPGRTEIIESQPAIVLDIAHNPASFTALIQALNQMKAYRDAPQKILVLAISRDKDAHSMLELILQHFDLVIFTAFVCNPRSRDPQELLAIANEIEASRAANRATNLAAAPTYQVCPSSAEAWELARSRASRQDLICIAGSVFLVADLRPQLVASKD